MTDRELMQQALDALVEIHPGNMTPMAEESWNKAIEALRARLAQPEPEPVAWTYQHEDTGLTMCVLTQQVEPGFEKNNPRWQKSTPLYTAPPQREWQGLTDEEITWLWSLAVEAKLENMPRHFARMVEENLKEKNT